jgi:hypothetical protein
VPKLDRIEVRRAVVVDELPPARSKERADWARIGLAGQHFDRHRDRASGSRRARPAGPSGTARPLPLTDDREGAKA